MNRDKLIEAIRLSIARVLDFKVNEKELELLADHLIANGIGDIAEIADKGERILDWESIRKENWSKEQIELYEIIKAYEHKDLATLAVNYFDDICTSKIKYEALKTENLKLTEQLKNSAVLPCKVGDTVYGINRYYSEENIHRMVNEQIKVIRGTQFCIKEQPFIWGIACKRLEWEDIPRIGTYVFVSKSEAEARLAELKEVEKI